MNTRKTNPTTKWWIPRGRAANQNKQKHHVWPWNPRMMYCPKDGKYHDFGCPCARRNQNLIPAALITYYQENWRQP